MAIAEYSSKTLGTRLPEDQEITVEKIAEREGRAVSDVIREAVDYWLRNKKNDDIRLDS